MKIRHYLPLGTLHPKFGGPTLSISTQCLGARRQGAEVSFVVYEGSRPWESQLTKAGVEMIHLPDPRNRFERAFAPAFYSFLAHQPSPPEIMHIHGVWMPTGFYAAHFAKKAGIPYVINPRGDTEVARINYNRFKKLKKMVAWHLYAKHTLSNAACLIATSQQEYESIRRLGCHAPVAIIPNGIDTSAFPQNISHCRGEKKVVLFLSRVNPIKGIEYLLKAWAELPGNLRSAWELHIAGNSDPVGYDESLKQLAADLGIAEEVKFLGIVLGEEKMRRYQDADLFVLPTINENFGNVVAEALMCECPVITTRNAPWSCLTEDKCGWWIELSVPHLKATLETAMSLSDEERLAMGRNGRTCITNRFSLAHTAEMTLAVYRWVLNRGECPIFVIADEPADYKIGENGQQPF